MSGEMPSHRIEQAGLNGARSSCLQRNRWNAALVGLTFLVAAIPILWVTFPPVMDLPNHLARIWLAAGAVNMPPLSAMYEIDWTQASTNVLVDFVAATLARVLPIFFLAKVILLLMFLRPPLCGCLLNRAIFGASSTWQVAFLALAWTTTAIAGFMSYQIGLAVALLCATYVRRKIGNPQFSAFATHTLFSGLLLLIHPFGLFFYAALVSGLVIGERVNLPLERGSLLVVARKLSIVTVSAFIPMMLLLLLAPHPPGLKGSDSGIVWSEPDLGNYVRTILSPVLSYDIEMDVLLAAPIAGLLVWSLAVGRLRMHAGLVIVAAVLALLSLVAPHSFGEATWLQRRLPLMAALTLLAGVSPAFDRQSAKLVFTSVLIITTALRIGWISWVWTDRQSDVTALFEAARFIDPGSRVITVQQQWADWRTAPTGRFMVGGPAGAAAVARSFGALLVIENRVFSPSLFAIPGQHVLKFRPGWQEETIKGPLFSSLLSKTNDRGLVLSDWRGNYDYVLLLNADMSPKYPLDNDGLELISGGGFAKVFRVNR